jgi:hypothetical protein
MGLEKRFQKEARQILIRENLFQVPINQNVLVLQEILLKNVLILKEKIAMGHVNQLWRF